MWSWLHSSVVPVVLGLAVLGVVSGIAFYALKRLREQIEDDKPATSELLSKFRELHQQGGLSDAEFRTIKTALGMKLQTGSTSQEQKPSSENENA